MQVVGLRFADIFDHVSPRLRLEMLLREDDGMLVDNAITAGAVERWPRIQQK
jgi:hypothetical protein